MLSVPLLPDQIGIRKEMDHNRVNSRKKKTPDVHINKYL